MSTSFHPSDEELADFIDETLDLSKEEEIIEHLIYCDECTKVVVEVMKQKAKEESSLKLANNTTSIPQQTKPKISAFEGQNTQTNNPTIEILAVNNSWFRNDKIRTIVLSGLVASFALFYIINKDTTIAIDKRLVENIVKTEPTIQFSSGSNKVTEIERNKRIVVLKEILKSTNLTNLDEFNKAEKEFENKNYDNASDLYYNVYNEINENEELKEKEKLKKIIVIYYKLYETSDISNTESQYIMNYLHRLQVHLDNYNAIYNKKEEK